MLGPSAHTDTFTRDNLPPEDAQPDFLLAGFDYPEYLNIGYELTDAMVEKGFGGVAVSGGSSAVVAATSAGAARAIAPATIMRVGTV